MHMSGQGHGDYVEPTRLVRKLVAILYADAAGYSRLTQEDEEGTHRVLRAHLNAIAAYVQGCNGRVVHYAGDAVLAEFGDVSDALTCAVDIQRHLAVRNSTFPSNRKVQFRIGVNFDEVIIDQGEIYGHGVNIAARLQSFADPGSICISAAVYDAVENQLPLIYEFVGEQTVKNIDELLPIYRVVVNSERATPSPLILSLIQRCQGAHKPDSEAAKHVRE